MAQVVKSFAVTIPAGTLQSANFSSSVNIGTSDVAQINVRVPPGPRGNVGFQIGSGGVPVVPSNAGGFVITDDDYIEWPVTDMLETGAWDILGYNLGQYDHTIYVTFLYDLVNLNASGSSAAVPVVAGTVVTG